MSNFYLNRRYKEGLSGKKPSIISDKEGYDAQMRGYEEYLSNQALADAIAEREEEREERRSRRRRTSDDYDSDVDSDCDSPPAWVRHLADRG